ncbi:hypothetical protein [Actinoplanes sp. M2I2]|uniref:hypothetical protein n=1 Tax=Actinoplanes sp. M2I2 TaxID=1734444 RepID=UPI00202181A4|nr:hypothetical protein [Actinoplanes sp. M2I2]
MSNLGFALEGAWKVLLAGLILGAGLPVLFALGIRSLAAGAGGGTAAPRPTGKVVAYALFAIVVLGVLLGLTVIVASGFGKTISFDQVYPAIVDK